MSIRFSEAIIYDEHTGAMSWRHRPVSHFPDERAAKIWNTRYAGKKAGYMRPDGYAGVSMNGNHHLAHRVAWAIMNDDVMPQQEVDHRNGLRTDNRYANLRHCTSSQNKMNKWHQSNSSHRLKGVYKDKKAFVSSINVNGKKIGLGSYPTKGLAAVAYAKASIRYHGEFSPYINR